MLSFEINVFLALIMAGLGYIGENLNKKEKKFLYTMGVYYSLFALVFLYSLMPIFMIEYKKYRFIVVSVGQIVLGLSCNLWGMYRLRKKI